MKRSKDVETYKKGQKIHGTRLTPIEVVSHRGLSYRCSCDCGKECIARHFDIKSKRVRSCGCLRNETSGNRVRTHGLSTRAEYFAAHSAWSRCTRKTDRGYKDYGGRGIRFEFKNQEDMLKWLVRNLPKPKSGRMMLDRIDNSKGYAPGNLRWATRSESARNTRANRIITINGVSKKLIEWSEISGVGVMTIHCRIRDGQPEALWLCKGKITKLMRAQHQFNGGSKT